MDLLNMFQQPVCCIFISNLFETIFPQIVENWNYHGIDYGH